MKRLEKGFFLLVSFASHTSCVRWFYAFTSHEVQADYVTERTDFSFRKWGTYDNWLYWLPSNRCMDSAIKSTSLIIPACTLIYWFLNFSSKVLEKARGLSMLYRFFLIFYPFGSRISGNNIQTSVLGRSTVLSAKFLRVLLVWLEPRLLVVLSSNMCSIAEFLPVFSLLKFQCHYHITDFKVSIKSYNGWLTSS